MLLKLTFLMALIVKIQIDLNYSYRYCKSFNMNPKSSSKDLKNKYCTMKAQLNVLI